MPGQTDPAAGNPSTRRRTRNDMKLTERVPLLRWSFWRMTVGMRNINRTGQVGDGREIAAVRYVREHARKG